MAYDIKARLRELVEEDSSRARDKDILYRLLSKELAGKEASVFPLLLTEYINHHVRRPGNSQGRAPARKGVVAAAPQAAPQQRALIMEAAGKRPLFLPALVTTTHDGWVAYDDMTEDNWREYISSRQRIARISNGLAEWGSHNLRALHEYKAETSGKLPEQVRASLLKRMPQTSGREVAAAEQRELGVANSA
jgi:hypothetical protein